MNNENWGQTKWFIVGDDESLRYAFPDHKFNHEGPYLVLAFENSEGVPTNATIFNLSVMTEMFNAYGNMVQQVHDKLKAQREELEHASTPDS